MQHRGAGGQLVIVWRLIAVGACVLPVGCDLSHAEAGDYGDWGAYGVAAVEVTVPRMTGGSFAAVLFHPADGAGQYDGSGAPYPAISFGHGFFQPVEQYESTLAHLASWGYFVIATRSQGGIFPDHAEYGRDLRDCLTWLETANGDPNTVWFEQVDVTRFGMSGHSMGGGASILATAEDPRVKALANLAAAETRTSAIARMPDVTVPVCLIAGSEDSLVPVENHGELMYAAANAPRQLPIIQGGFHCGFVDSYFFGCDSGSLSRAAQLEISRRLLTAFFELHLRGDQAAWSAVWGPDADGDPAVDVQRDAGFALESASAELEACPGDEATLAVTVSNTGLAAESFELLLAPAEWEASFAPAAVGPLAAGTGADAVLTVNVPTDAAPDVELVISARRLSDNATRAYAVVPLAGPLLRGDCDCDGDVDFDDIGFFVTAIGDDGVQWAAQYLAQFGNAPPCCFESCDLTGDGMVDFYDITPFVDAIGT